MLHLGLIRFSFLEFLEFHIMVKLSKTSKLGTYSWSLQARETCPGSVDADGVTVPACAGCYAVSGFYRMKPVIKVRKNNRKEWQAETFVQDMIAALRHERYFRLFDSGDFYHVDLVKKWFDICEALPDTKFWIPTRSHKVAKLALWIHKLAALPNVSVRYSADSVDGTYDAALHGSVIYSDNTQLDLRDVVSGLVYPCPAYTDEHGGKCLACRQCYDKQIPVIAYRAHGLKMKKVIRLAVVNG